MRMGTSCINSPPFYFAFAVRKWRPRQPVLARAECGRPPVQPRLRWRAQHLQWASSQEYECANLAERRKVAPFRRALSQLAPARLTTKSLARVVTTQSARRSWPENTGSPLVPTCQIGAAGESRRASVEPVGKGNQRPTLPGKWDTSTVHQHREHADRAFAAPGCAEKHRTRWQRRWPLPL